MDFYQKISDETKVELHRAFLEKSNRQRPLLGAVLGWEGLNRYTEDTEKVFPSGPVSSKALIWDRFQSLFDSYAEMIGNHDDLFYTLEPFSFFPWTEAAMGCHVTYTGKNFWSVPPEGMNTPLEIQTQMESIQTSLAQYTVGKQGAGTGETAESLKWVIRYGEILDALTGRYGESYPVGQSVLRGPLDMLAAVLGIENMIYFFLDQSSLMKELLDTAASLFLSFCQVQALKTPRYRNGYVIGTYHIWTPGSCLRLQEDAIAMLSPDMYREFVHPVDCRIAGAAEYSLFHLHSNALQYIDILSENPGLHILQVSKDEGTELAPLLPALEKIQDSGKCLILKGRFNNEELRLIKRSLDFRGLCIQAVALTNQEADNLYSVF